MVNKERKIFNPFMPEIFFNQQPGINLSLHFVDKSKMVEAYKKSLDLNLSIRIKIDPNLWIIRKLFVKNIKNAMSTNETEMSHYQEAIKTHKKLSLGCYSY